MKKKKKECRNEKNWLKNEFKKVSSHLGKM